MQDRIEVSSIRQKSANSVNSFNVFRKRFLTKSYDVGDESVVYFNCSCRVNLRKTNS